MNQIPEPFRRRLFPWLFVLLGIAALLTGFYSLYVRFQWLGNSKDDFQQDYLAARNLLIGDSIYSYDGNLYDNYHPPSVAPLFVPLALLPYQTANRLWGIFSLLCLYYTVWIILQGLYLKLSLRWWFLLAGFLICWYPVQVHITAGQLSIQITLCLVSAWVLLRKKYEFAAGFLIGLACLLKFFPALLVVFLLLRRKWKALGAFCITLCAGYLLALCTVGLSDILTFATVVLPQDSRQYAAYPINLSLFSVFIRLFTITPWFTPILDAPFIANMMIAVSYLSLLAGLVYYTLRLPRTQHGDDLSFGLHCTLVMLLSPVMWQHAAMLLFLPWGLVLKTTLVPDNLPITTQRKRNQLQIHLLVAISLVSLPDIKISQSLMDLYAPYPPPWYVGAITLCATTGILITFGLMARTAQAQIRLKV